MLRGTVARSAVAVELFGVGGVAKEHLLGDVRGVVATARVAGDAVHEVPVVGRCSIHLARPRIKHPRVVSAVRVGVCRQPD
jgi:hypothetical protein